MFPIFIILFIIKVIKCINLIKSYLIYCTKETEKYLQKNNDIYSDSFYDETEKDALYEVLKNMPNFKNEKEYNDVYKDLYKDYPQFCIDFQVVKKIKLLS